MAELIKIGYIAKAHGIKGELYFRPLEPDGGWFSEIKEIYVDETLYKIEKSRPHQDGYILVLKNVVDRNKAEELKARSVLIPQEYFMSQNNDDEYFLNEIKGFEVFVDEKLKGFIEGFSSTQAHEIALIKTSEGVFEVPWVKAFIKELDFKGKKVELDCPRELLEKNFGEGGGGDSK